MEGPDRSADWARATISWATERSGCSAAGDDTSTGPSLIWREQFSAVKSGELTIARSTPSDVFSLGLNNMPGRDLWNPGVTPFRDRRSVTAGLRSVDPDLKPTSQDQWSAGADYQWRPDTVVGARYVHQKLRRAVEDLAVLVQGNASYIYANPGEGIASSAPFTTGLTARPLAYPKPVRNYDAVEFTFRTALLEELVRKLQLHVEPPVRQLLRPCQFRRDSHADNRAELGDSSAAGRQHCASCALRQPGMGP